MKLMRVLMQVSLLRRPYEVSWQKVSWRKALLRQLKGWTPVGRFQEGIGSPFILGELSDAVGRVGGLLKAARLGRRLGCLCLAADSEISLFVEP